MATTYERTDSKGRKYRQLDYTTPGGRRVRKSLGPVRAITQREAKIAAGAKDYEVRTGKPAWVPAPLFENFRTEYLEWRAKKFPRSQVRVAQILKADCMNVFVGRALSDPDMVKLIDSWQVNRLDCVSNNSMAKEYRSLHAFFEKAIRWKRGITENPCAAGDETERPKEKKRKPRIAHSSAEAAKMFVQERWGNVWKLMYNTGMRREEARQAEVSWFNVEKRELTIRSQAGDIEAGAAGAPRVKGRGRTAVLDKGWEPKSSHFRVVPLNARAVEAFKALTKGREKERYVVRRVGRRSLSKAFERDARRAGLKGSLHCTRHSYGMALAEAGVPLPTIQRLMGHANIQTTMIYAITSKEHALRLALKVAV